MTLNEFMPKLWNTLLHVVVHVCTFDWGKKQIGHTYRGKRDVGSCKIKHFIQPQRKWNQWLIASAIRMLSLISWWIIMVFDWGNSSCIRFAFLSFKVDTLCFALVSLHITNRSHERRWQTKNGNAGVEFFSSSTLSWPELKPSLSLSIQQYDWLADNHIR
jgi:hypothetical protein